METILLLTLCVVLVVGLITNALLIVAVKPRVIHVEPEEISFAGTEGYDNYGNPIN